MWIKAIKQDHELSRESSSAALLVLKFVFFHNICTAVESYEKGSQQLAKGNWKPNRKTEEKQTGMNLETSRHY